MDQIDLASWRTARGWTAPQAARYVGTRTSTYRNWETGKREPPAILWRLMNVLGTIEIMAPAIHSTMLPGEDPRPGRKGRKPSNPS